MQTYLESIRTCALAILDRGRAWDGGLFKLMGEHRVLYSAIANRTLDKRRFLANAKAALLSGGSLTAIVFSLLLIVLLLAIVVASAVHRCCRRSSAQQQQSRRRSSSLRQKLRSRVRDFNDHLPVSPRLLLGLLCLLLLVAALVPLVLAFAANSRLHASVSEQRPDHPGSVAAQLTQVFRHADAFLANLVPAARQDLKPVIRQTLDMTAKMKAKSQGAYQGEFRQVIGANNLTDASSDLLDRIGLYYRAGKRLKSANERIYIALSSLARLQLYHYESVCLRSAAASVCANHTDSVNVTLKLIQDVHSSWTTSRPSDGAVVKDSIRDVGTFLGNLVGTLDGTGNTPEKQQQLKEQKLRLSQEFNRNITDVFDVELNSTAFVLSGVESKLAELEEKLTSARESLANASTGALAAYARASSRLETARFGATTAVGLLLLLALVCLSTAAVVSVAVPGAAKAHARSLACAVHLSYLLFCLAVAFACLLFCLTGYLQTQACRYLYDNTTADRFLVPEVNAVIVELKARAAADPNKTDAIPLKGIGRLVGGLLDGCQANQPIVRALEAVEFIDTGVSDSAKQSLAFKELGRDLLRREMSRANLEQLRDPNMEEKMASLRTIFAGYGQYNFSAVGTHLADQVQLLDSARHLLDWLGQINERIDSQLPSSEDSTRKLSRSNRLNVRDALGAVGELINVTRELGTEMPALESGKHVVQVIDRVISANKLMDVYLSNQTLWTDTAVSYYTKHVIEGSTAESQEIADSTAVGFLSSIGKCRHLYSLYTSVVGIPCQTLLYPLSILWYCLAWFLWFGILLAAVVHLSIICLVDTAPQPQHQAPIDNDLPLTKRPIAVNNADKIRESDLTVQDPLFSRA